MRNISNMMERVRPVGISIIIFFALLLGKDNRSIFHILGPWVTLLMTATASFESLFIGEQGSEKVGYAS